MLSMLSSFWFQTWSNRFIAPAASPIRRMYSDLELSLLDWMLPSYVNSCTGSTVFPFTVSEDAVGPDLRFWIFVLAQEMWRPNFEASSSIADRAARYFSSLSISRVTSSA